MPHPHLVREDSDAGFVRLKLNRPQRRNALDENMVLSLLDELSADPTTVIILGSTDPTIFSAGADLDVSDDERARLSDLLYRCYERMVTRPGPVIAVVEGPAVGGGAQLASAADLRVAGPGARFRWVGPGHGLAVGAWVLPSLIGRGSALELMLTSRWLDFPEADELGLVIAGRPDPWRAAEEIAAGVAALDTSAVSRIKAVASTDGLVERLAAERYGNRTSWAGSVDGVREGS